MGRCRAIRPPIRSGICGRPLTGSVHLFGLRPILTCLSDVSFRALIRLLPEFLSANLCHLWVQGGDDGGGVMLYDSKQNSSSCLRLSPLTFPVFYCIKAESKGAGKPRLGQSQAPTNRFDVNLFRNMNLEALGSPCQERFNLIESCHHLFECRLHDSPFL